MIIKECPHCGNTIWKYVTESKTIPLGNGEVKTIKSEHKICIKCQKKLK